MKRILALVPSQLGYSPGQRSTIEIWERALRDAGIAVHYAPFESAALRRVLGRRGHFLLKTVEMLRGLARRTHLLRSIDLFDAVYVYREAALIGPAVFERWVARRRPLIYSLDDPLYVPYVSPTNGWLSHLKFFGKVAEICRLSRVVIVNSPFHAEFARPHNRNLWEIPSLVDERAYRYEPEPTRGHTTCVGWTGSPSTAPNLGLVTGALKSLAECVTFRLHVIGAQRLDLPKVESTAQTWRAESEVADLRQIDVGLVPLPDNPWNRRKFNLKIAQYMTLGIVPVATPLGSNPQVIDHGVDGFLASTSAEWVHYLGILLREEQTRLLMASRAALKGQSQFTLQAHAQAIIEAFRAGLASRP